MLPQYVKFSSMTPESARKDAEAWASDPLSIHPRYAVLNESERPGLNLRVHFPQCKTARQVPLVYGSLDLALLAVRACLSELLASFGDYWGDVGIQPELAAMMSNMAECFWSYAMQNQHSGHACQIAFLVQLFLQDTPVSWSTSASNLQSCGFGSKKLRGLRKQRSAFTGQSRFAVCATRGTGRPQALIVYICGAERCLDENLILQSIFTEQDLVWPKPGRPKDHHCWHAVLVLAHNALANGASSSCERIGSLLHAMHSEFMPSARTVHRLRLREAKILCIGEQENEELLDDLTDVFLEAGKTPLLGRVGKWKRQRHGLPVEGQLGRNEPGSASSRQHTSESAKENAKEMLLSTAVGRGLPDSDKSKYSMTMPVSHLLQGATAQRTTRGGQSQTEILPVQPFVLRGRGARQGATRSVQRQRLADWLQSEEGQDWAKEKERLWQGFVDDMTPAHL
eukprot:s418_g33.t1